MPADDARLDGCDLDFTADPTSDDDLDFVVVFAEALDPNSDKTVAEAEAEWRELFG